MKRKDKQNAVASTNQSQNPGFILVLPKCCRGHQILRRGLLTAAIYSIVSTVRTTTLLTNLTTPQVDTGAGGRANVLHAPSALFDKQQQQPPKAPSNAETASKTPELFMDRLNRLLPDCPPDNILCDKDQRLFVDDVAKLEEEIMAFDIPAQPDSKPILLKFKDSDYVSIQNWRWINDIDHARNQPVCPHCELRHNSTRFAQWNQTTRPDERAHVLLHKDCPERGVEREHPQQVLIGACGESSEGSGAGYYHFGYKAFDYSAGFYNPHQNNHNPRVKYNHSEPRALTDPFAQTYAHLHFSPDDRPHGNLYPPHDGLMELHNVTQLVQLLLRPPTPFPRHPNATEDGMFTHNGCLNDIRADFVNHLGDPRVTFSLARYGQCFHNKPSPFHDQSCANMSAQQFFHGDCEAHRDASKTILSSWHKFTFSLENTLSPDYFTEKRYQALLAGSVPIVWDNDNSLQYLPDPDAAVVVNQPNMTGDEIQDLFQELHFMSEKDYVQKFFAWKKRGLRPSFVRRLFLSTDYQACRICEFVAHYHFGGKRGG